MYGICQIIQDGCHGRQVPQMLPIVEHSLEIDLFLVREFRDIARRRILINRQSCTQRLNQDETISIPYCLPRYRRTRRARQRSSAPRHLATFALRRPCSYCMDASVMSETCKNDCFCCCEEVFCSRLHIVKGGCRQHSRLKDHASLAQVVDVRDTRE